MNLAAKHLKVIVLFFLSVSLFLVSACSKKPWQHRDVETVKKHMGVFSPSLTLSDDQIQQEIDITWYEQKNQTIRYQGQKIIDVDFQTFVPLGWSYGLDDYALYIGTERYPIDRKSLIIYRDYNYLASSGAVYRMSEGSLHLISGADIWSFEPLSQQLEDGTLFYGSPYARDSDHVYHRNTILSWADVKTFTLIDGWTWQDKDTIYYQDGSTHPIKK